MSEQKFKKGRDFECDSFGDVTVTEIPLIKDPYKKYYPDEFEAKFISKPDGGQRMIILKSEELKERHVKIRDQLNEHIADLGIFKNIFTIGEHVNFSRFGMLSALYMIKTRKIKDIKANRVSFLDIKAAYDSVDRKSLSILEDCIPYETYKEIMYYYSIKKFNIVEDEKVVDSISVDTGIYQGCVLSRVIFGIILGNVLNNECGFRMSSMAYVDDMVLWHKDEKEQKENILELSSALSQVGLELNSKKTHLVEINDGWDITFLQAKLNDKYNGLLPEMGERPTKRQFIKNRLRQLLPKEKITDKTVDDFMKRDSRSFIDETNESNKNNRNRLWPYYMLIGFKERATLRIMQLRYETDSRIDEYMETREKIHKMRTILCDIFVGNVSSFQEHKYGESMEDFALNSHIRYGNRNEYRHSEEDSPDTIRWCKCDKCLVDSLMIDSLEYISYRLGYQYFDKEETQDKWDKYFKYIRWFQNRGNNY